MQLSLFFYVGCICSQKKDEFDRNVRQECGNYMKLEDMQKMSVNPHLKNKTWFKFCDDPRSKHYGKNALHVAVENNRYEITKLLLAHGISPVFFNINGLSRKTHTNNMFPCSFCLSPTLLHSFCVVCV